MNQKQLVFMGFKIQEFSLTYADTIIILHEHAFESNNLVRKISTLLYFEIYSNPYKETSIGRTILHTCIPACKSVIYIIQIEPILHVISEHSLPQGPLRHLHIPCHLKSNPACPLLLFFTLGTLLYNRRFTLYKY